MLGGKSGPEYVLRQGHLGGIAGQVSSADICLSYGGAAVSGSVVYLPCVDGVRAVRVDSAGHLRVLWHAFGQVAGSPVIGGGRVWALDQYGGVLHALSPATGKTLEQVRVGVDQPLRHAGDLRQPGARAHHDRRDLRPDLLNRASGP